MIDQMLFFRGATEEKPRKTTEDATSSNENKTAGHAFLRSVAFPLTTRPVTKLLQPSSLLFYLSYFFPLSLSFSHYHVIFSDVIFLLFKSFRFIFKLFRSFYKIRIHPSFQILSSRGRLELFTYV